MDNVCCRIFKEQVNILKSLPNQENAKTVLYQAILTAYNQFENQDENQNENQFEFQNENQNEKGYIDIDILSLNILNLLIKNIIFKQYSSNCGGKRDGAGRPRKNQNENQIEKNKQNVIDIIHSVSNKFNCNGIKIDEEFSVSKYEQFDAYVKEFDSSVIQAVEKWIKKEKMGQFVEYGFITRQFFNFAKRQNKPIFKEIVNE